jgi:hypothetical protein
MKMFGSADKFFYRNLAGINLGSPGYRRIMIRPQPVGDLQSVTAVQQTVRGQIEVEWTRGDTSLDLNVSIPPGTEADVSIPKVSILRPSRPGELHPEPLTDPDMTLSRHPARAVRERLSPFIQVGGFLPLPVDPTWIGPPTPFAPLRLQQLRHYCEVVRP